ncbi:MAG: serine/threonine-protein kinase [Mycobacterium sp.]
MAVGESRVGQTFGKYTIVSRLGKGGMGEVYEAYDDSKGRTVALKILSPQFSQDEAFRTRFKRESRAAAILQEPHVIPIHDWGEVDGNLFIDMRLVRGKTLYDVLELGPIDPARAVAIVGGVASALDAAHAAGLVHRDIKPQNIILTSDDFPYLVDFGIAEAKGDPGLTMTGTYLGTVAYMAPERFGGQNSTPAVDVYALACVLYEALTGHPPFPHGGLEQAMMSHLTAPPPRPSQAQRAVSPAFDQVIARGMAKEPADRYASAGALVAAAKHALIPQEPPTVATPTVQHTPPRAQPYVDPFRPRQQPPPHPSTPPPRPPYPPQPPPTGRPKWVLPSAIAFVAVLAIGLVAVVIGLNSGGSNRPVATDTSPTDDSTGPTSTSATIGPTSTPGASSRPTSSGPTASAPQAPPAPPPLVTGPDLSAARETCDGGYFLTNRNGFGTHAGRGTPETSCRFMDSVLNAYWTQYGDASRSLRPVSAAGSVACNTVLTDGAGCDGDNFLMQCQAYPGQGYITCEGGRNAVVYLF